MNHLNYLARGFFLFILLMAFSQVSNAQWTTNANGHIYRSSGNVGIGISAPVNKLDVNGAMRTKKVVLKGNDGIRSEDHSLSFYPASVSFWAMKSNRGMEVYTLNGKLMGSLYHDKDLGFGLRDGDSHWVIKSEKDRFISFIVDNNEKMRVLDSGALMIGKSLEPAGYTTATGDAYRLYVKGGGLFEEVKVETGWADYVFEDDYDLNSLEAVEQHIEEHGHLHNTPSANEIAQSGGVELGSMTVKQQEKIEELFLHIIELNKQIKDLKSKIED